MACRVEIEGQWTKSYPTVSEGRRSLDPRVWESAMKYKDMDGLVNHVYYHRFSDLKARITYYPSDVKKEKEVSGEVSKRESGKVKR